MLALGGGGTPPFLQLFAEPYAMLSGRLLVTWNGLAGPQASVATRQPHIEAPAGGRMPEGWQVDIEHAPCTILKKPAGTTAWRGLAGIASSQASSQAPGSRKRVAAHREGRHWQLLLPGYSKRMR